MKKNSLLINVGRGSSINEEDLIKSFKSKIKIFMFHWMFLKKNH